MAPLRTHNEDKLINRASVLVMLWSARLAGFLLFRVLKTGSDTRFDEMRSHFFRFAGFWAGQILWVWVVCTSSLSSEMIGLISSSTYCHPQLACCIRLVEGWEQPFIRYWTGYRWCRLVRHWSVLGSCFGHPKGTFSHSSV